MVPASKHRFLLWVFRTHPPHFNKSRHPGEERPWLRITTKLTHTPPSGYATSSRGGRIAPGDVDERSIEDVHPDDLKHYTQCHFFAGIGVWSHALRRAGWPDDRPVWTGSCPCQPFSSAGQGDGFDDPRHLWPAFAWLIRERKPAELFGEQVASKDAEPWLDLVQADLEAMGYAFGAIAFPSAGVGAPHIRDRTYWVANANSGTSKQGCSNFRGRSVGGHAQPWAGSGSSSVLVGLDHTNNPGLERHTRHGGTEGRQGSQRPATAASLPVRLADTDYQHQQPTGNTARAGNTSGLSKPIGLADTHGGLQSRSESRGSLTQSPPQRAQDTEATPGCSGDSWSSPVNGLWRDADWLFCRDGKWRPVEPGTFPLANGATGRVGRLRAYGNAINAEAATQFIAAYLETL
ncbi:MAG: DNA cytosine methyltransferase [Pseudomonas sp.]